MMYTKKTYIAVLIAFVAGAGIFYLTKSPTQAILGSKEYVDADNGISFKYPSSYEVRIIGDSGVSIGIVSDTNKTEFVSVYNVAYIQPENEFASQITPISLVCNESTATTSKCFMTTPEAFETKSDIQGQIVYVEEEGRFKDENNVPILFSELNGPFYVLPIMSNNATTTTIIVHAVDFNADNINITELQKIAKSIKISK